MMLNLAPIVLFTFNRLSQTQKTIEALAKNELAKQSTVYIFCDGVKADASEKKIQEVQAVRQYLKAFFSDKSSFKEVIIVERDENWGLSKSIIEGVTEVVNKHGRVIVLEDDIVTSPFFLKFMNEGLSFYDSKKEVLSINSCNFFANDGETNDTFFSVMADCWGWATWADRWSLFERDGQKLMNELQKRDLIKRFNLDGSYNFKNMLQQQIDGKISSWAVRWLAVSILSNKLNLFPNPALSNHIAGDGATHAKESVLPPLSKNPILITDISLEIDEKAHQKMRRAYFRQHGLKSKIKLLLENIF